MRRHYARIQASGGEVVAISFEPLERVVVLARQMQLPFPLVSDVELGAYRAYGLRRGTLLQVFGPSTIWTYVKLLVRGRRYQGTQSDVRQLGGNFVIDPAGRVQFEHQGQAPNDRPSVEQLLEVLSRI